MKKTKRPHLTLSAERIRDLDVREVQQAVGGITGAVCPSGYATCNCTRGC